MSSPAVIDIDALVQPIPGDNPAGVPLPDLLRFELDDLRKDADPMDPATAGRRADWPKVVKLASNALETKSKDYLLGVRLLEALARKSGLPGMRDGLRLLHRLTTDCWESIHPMPEEGETMDVREGAFKWINDVGRGARFPQTVLEMPLFKASGRTFSYVDSISGETKAEFDEAAPRADAASLKLGYELLGECNEALRDLAAALDERMGAEIAPDFLSMETSTNIGSALQKCVELVEQTANKRGVKLGDEAPAEDAAEGSGDAGGESSGDSSGGSTDGGVGTGIANNREALYNQLSRIASALKAIEPHSPIPYLLERCVRMGGMPFPELLRAIVRETSVLDEVDRLLGLEAPAQTESY
jgi:type VI secretion system protein ImpA